MKEFEDERSARNEKQEVEFTRSLLLIHGFLQALGRKRGYQVMKKCDSECDVLELKRSILLSTLCVN